MRLSRGELKNSSGPCQRSVDRKSGVMAVERMDQLTKWVMGLQSPFDGVYRLAPAETRSSRAVRHPR